MSFRLCYLDQKLASQKVDCLVLGVFSDGRPQKAISFLAKPTRRAVRQAIKSGWITGKSGEHVFLTLSKQPQDRLLLVGLGEKKKITIERLRRLGGTLAKVAEKNRVASLLCLVSLEDLPALSKRQTASTIAEGARLADYRFTSFISDEEKKDQGTLDLFAIAVNKGQAARWSIDLKRVESEAKGVFLARDLANNPPNKIFPEALAQEAMVLSRKYPIYTTILDELQMNKLGMGGILGVGQGSDKPPRMIVMEYLKGPSDQKPFVAVGKAVTFDTGGISLKPPTRMEEMKFDMCGG
ncbi:leucyl aminopeptidase family protein, partial [Magnetococcales bacterium HHB-1]